METAQFNIAIIIPFFKINFFEKTLESLARQTDKRFQVYIGDDASSNSPEELLKNYQGKFNFSYKRFDNNLGSISLAKQWERCIELMQDEEWLMILGDDDVLGYNVIKAFYENLLEIEQTSNVVRFSSVVINEKDEEISEEYHHPKLENAIESYCRKLKGESRSSLSEYIFRKEKYLLYKFRNYNFAWGSDDYAVIQFSEERPIFSLNELIFVRISNVNITGNLSLKKEKIIEDIRVVKDLLRYNKYLSINHVNQFIKQYNDQLYRSKSFYFLLELKLFFLVFYKKGVKQSISQIIISFKRFLFNNIKIEYLYWSLRTRKLRKLNNIKIFNSQETLEKIINERKSISRFGDGEFKIIFNDGNPSFQNYDLLLSKRLIEVLNSQNKNLLISIPITFISLKNEKISSRFFWKQFLNKYSEQLNSLLRKDYVYGNAGVTRFYIGQTNKKLSYKISHKLKKIWDNKEILIVEGKYSRLGVGNDLFENAASIERILCPVENAFNHYEKILELSMYYGANKLIIIALGPTATVLAHDLANKGFWALDLGHVDIEYEWMKSNTLDRIQIKGKFVSEMGNQTNNDFNEFFDSVYNSQIKFEV